MADLTNIVQIPLVKKEYLLKYIMLVNPTPDEIDKWSMKLPDGFDVEAVWLVPIITDKEIAISVDYSNILERCHTTKPIYFPWKEDLMSKGIREMFIAYLFNEGKVQEILFECLND